MPELVDGGAEDEGSIEIEEGGSDQGGLSSIKEDDTGQQSEAKISGFSIDSIWDSEETLSDEGDLDNDIFGDGSSESGLSFQID